MTKRILTILASLLLLALAALATSGCEGCGGGVGGTGSGTIQPAPSQVSFGQVDVGESSVETLRLINASSNEDLSIFDIELVPGDDGHIDQLQIVDMPGLTAELQPGEEIEVDIEYTPTEEAPTNRGEIRVENSDATGEHSPLYVPVRTLGNEPQFFPEPTIVRFQRMQPGESADQRLRITNIGSGPLRIFEPPQYSGGDDFRLQEFDRDFPVELSPYDSSGAQENPDEYALYADVVYQPLGDGQDSGRIQFETNDVDDPSQDDRETKEVEVVADADAPCIAVDGRTRDFGQIPLGEITRENITITNCGSEDLEISSIVIEDDETGVYDLDLGAWDQNSDGTLDGVVSLEPDESDQFGVDFIPFEEGTRTAEVVITSNDQIQSPLGINLTARGAEGTCPTAMATATIDGAPMAPGTSITATPLDNIILDGTGSTDEDGEVIDWQWEVVESPPGTNVDLQQVEDDGSIMEFQALTAGDYLIGLDVIDDSGFNSCEQAVVEITSIPDQNIHIELTWTNPEDPDETDDTGSDLDVHLVKMGPGEWFDLQWSVFFQHPNTDGSDIWDPEDPSLDIDVRNGAGPENITMDTPDHCQWYAVGVHYYDEMWGTAYATIRIYINGDLRYERPFFPLENDGDFWDAARIHWDDNQSDATIVGVDAFYPVAPYNSAPEVTDQMSNLGLCTAENLY